MPGDEGLELSRLLPLPHGLELGGVGLGGHHHAVVRVLDQAPGRHDGAVRYEASVEGEAWRVEGRVGSASGQKTVRSAS